LGFPNVGSSETLAGDKKVDKFGGNAAGEVSEHVLLESECMQED